MLQSITTEAPLFIQEILDKQLRQLRNLNVAASPLTSTLHLEGDQYRAYTTIIRALTTGKQRSYYFFITGPGGTGKSFLLRSLVDWCTISKKKPLLLAPTGIAANNISGQTIHSALSLFSEESTYVSSIFSRQDKTCLEELRTIKVLIIDEISMVDALLLGFLSSIFCKIHKRSEPFGNMHVLAFGDLMQLPPISGGKVFTAPVWKIFHPLFLRDPQRQIQDRRFFDLLNKVRFGIIDEEVKRALREQASKFSMLEQTYLTTFLCALRPKAEALNGLILETLPKSSSKANIFQAIDREDGTLVNQDLSRNSRPFKRGTNFPPIVVCTIGARVMFLTNSMIQQGISNGTCGVIIALDPITNEPEVAFPTKEGIRVRLIFFLL
jgi:ATP-dependent DNA helicase PIF1